MKPYQQGVKSHSLVKYTNSGEILGMSKDAFENYLFIDGKPMSQQTDKQDKGAVTITKYTDKDGKESTSEELLYTPMDIMKLDKKKQLVIFQGFYNRPIEADHQQAWQDPRLAGYMAMGESTPLPEFLIPSHHAAMGYTGTPRVYNPQTHEIKVLA